MVCFVSVWGEGVGVFFFFLAVSLFWVLASRPALLNCRRFFAFQSFLSGDVCGWAVVSRVPCASTGLGSKIGCSIDEKVP